MQVDILKRHAELSVGELANFRNQPRSGHSGAHRWRANVGQQWHKESAQQALASYPEATFEQSISGKLLQQDWTFSLNGRMDQLLPETDSLIIREVKTVRHSLPCPPEDLNMEYPAYFIQAALYLRLARLLPEYATKKIKAELLFIEISSGVAQIVPLGTYCDELADRQLERLVAFLDERRARRIAIKELDIRPAFPSLREGQPELIKQLESASLKRSTVLLQAPTGFGKTGIVLEHVLRQMQNGLYERCIYLTSKSSGQLETVRQLRSMIGNDLRYIQMRNRGEHEIDSLGDEEPGRNWMEAGINPPELFKEGTLSLERAKELGHQTGICPYELTKACLPFAELWIGDSNYLFAPHSQHVFQEPDGFDPAKTILVIDEAHNLPTRNADALSIELNGNDLFFAIEELRGAGAKRLLLNCLRRIAAETSAMVASTVLDLEQIYALGDLCEEAAQLLDGARFDHEATAPFALETVWQLPELAKRLLEASSHWLYWCPEQGTVRAQCLDASQWTADCMKVFSSKILMSATLDPLESYQAEIGLKLGEISLAIGWADWRENAYDVAIDCRIDSRIKHRSRHYETTAQTIASMADSQPGEPLVVFFPSYQYAENIRAYLSALDESLRVSIQPRGVTLGEQERFIDEALLLADVLFLIIGSSYAEGIDKLGGCIRSVIVVSPALPEVNPVQKARMEIDPTVSREAAFNVVYLIPAMRRIHQALGRFVRAPGQQARILLHCKRFAQLEYFNCLDRTYQSDRHIKNEVDLIEWLNQEHRTLE